MTECYYNLFRQALSKSDDSVRLEFIAIVDLVKNIAQVLNYRIEATIKRKWQIFCILFRWKRKGAAKYGWNR